MKKLTVLITALVLILSACISENISESSGDISLSSSSESDTPEISSSVASSFGDESFISSESSDIPDESSDTSSDNIIIETMHYEEIDISQFEQYVVYTDILDPGGIWPMNYVFEDHDRFVKSHYGTFNKDQLYNLDRAVGDYPSYREWVKKYDVEFFEEHDLIVIICESKFEVLPSLISMYCSDMGRFMMYIDNDNPYGEETQGFHLFVEVPKGYLGENPDIFGVRNVDKFEENYQLEHKVR